MHLEQEQHATRASTAAADEREDIGGWTRSTYDYAPAPGTPDQRPADTSGVAPAAAHTGQLLRVVVERHDPTVISTHATEQVQAIADVRTKLDVIPPAPRPGWALQLGVEDLLGSRTLRVEARRHLLGPFWAGLALVPARRELGVAVAVEW